MTLAIAGRTGRGLRRFSLVPAVLAEPSALALFLGNHQVLRIP
jgi:hypothetical protein